VVTWHPGIQDDALRTEGGDAIHGRSEYLTMWHGVDPSLLRVRAQPVLGDDRDAVLTATPTQILVDLDAAKQPRRLVTAVRRLGNRPATPTSFGAFWTDGEGAIRPLHEVTLPAAPQTISEAWTPFVCEVPPEAGTLTLVCRDPRPVGDAPAVEVAWQAPRVQEVTRARDPRPDVLLVTIDTLRADALSAAPQLQSVLARGSLWPRAISPSNWTLPSYASLFTGLPADEHQAGRGPFAVEPSNQPENRQLSAVDDSLTTLAEQFRQAGYATGMVHQNPMLETWTGLNRGFESYARASDRTEDALAWVDNWLAQPDSRPRFVVLHLMAPHLPYRVGPEPDPLTDLPMASFFGNDHSVEDRRSFFDLPTDARETVRERYRAEVARMDAEVGPWLEQRLNDSQDQLLIGFHSDHGEEFWEDGSFEHGHSFDDSVVHVPVGLVWPGQVPAQRHAQLVGAADLGTSLLDLAGIPHTRASSLAAPPERLQSSMPLYRAPEFGRVYFGDQVDSIPWDPTRASGGFGAPISSDKRRMLAELGYLAGQEMRPPAQDGEGPR
jgi:hypothetical protein